MYAIIEDSGQQFRVAEGDVLEIDLRDLAEGAQQVVFDRVLLVGDGERIQVGRPTVPGARVTADIVNPLFKGPKVHVYYWRRRKSSRGKVGHRQKYVQVRIAKIEG